MSRTKALPLTRAHMPADFSISLGTYLDGDGTGTRRIPEDFGPRQPMHGFEETYHNIIDYIVRITYRIWEDRDIEYIRDCYSDDSRVYDDYGLQLGNEKIVGDTYHTTGAFSDIQLIADEIVWAGDEEIGFHTSHRTLIRGTNDGKSIYGPPTTRSVDVMVIANCVALENEIFLEHVCYNTSSMLQQLGFDPDDMAATLIHSPPAGWPRDEQTWQQLRMSVRPPEPLSISEPVSGFDVDEFVRGNLDKLWNLQDYHASARLYQPGCRVSGPADKTFAGIGAYYEFVRGVRTAFPDLEVQMDEVYWMGNEHEGFLTSERWSATGTHGGAGPYGAPTDREVQIWGITQHRIIDGRITEVWMLFNDLDLRMQIAAAHR